MSPEEFVQSAATQDQPSSDWSVPLQSLWWAAHGDWHKAHDVLQSDDGPRSAWVHAHLHREEGDISNADYWYQKANRRVCTDSIVEERLQIIESLVRGCS